VRDEEQIICIICYDLFCLFIGIDWNSVCRQSYLDNKFHGVYGDYEQHLEFSGAEIRQIPDLHPVMTKEEQSNRVTRALKEESAKKDWFAMVQPGQELKLLYTLKTSKPLSVQMQTSRRAFMSPFKVVDGKDQTIKEKVVETKSVKVNDNMDKTELKMAVPKGVDGVRVTMIDTVYYGKKFTTVMYLFTNMDAADEYFKKRFGVKCPLEPVSKGFSLFGSKNDQDSKVKGTNDKTAPAENADETDYLLTDGSSGNVLFNAEWRLRSKGCMGKTLGAGKRGRVCDGRNN
jgi:hypothetical protein